MSAEMNEPGRTPGNTPFSLWHLGDARSQFWGMASLTRSTEGLAVGPRHRAPEYIQEEILDAQVPGALLIRTNAKPAVQALALDEWPAHPAALPPLWRASVFNGLAQRFSWERS